MSLHNFQRDSGSGLIWFTSLLALVALLSGTLISASHEYLYARRVTDYTEELALAVKTRMNLDARSSISDTGRSVFLATVNQFSFAKVRVRSIEMQTGETVHVVVCATWIPPLPLVIGSREICEEAFAR